MSSNDEIKELLAEERIVQTLKEEKWADLDACVEIDEGTLKDALDWKSKSKRPLRGWPKKRWIDEPDNDFRILGVDNP